MDFVKAICRLQNIRKQIDTESANMQDDPWMCAAMDDCSLSITLAIKDLVRIHKTLKERKENANNDKND